MRYCTSIIISAFLATLPGALGGTIALGKSETVLTVADTTLNLNALAARQLPIPSLTLCQSANCGAPCYSYYLGGDGNGVCYQAIGLNPSGYVLSSQPTAWEIHAGDCPGAWLMQRNTCYNISPPATNYEVIYH